MADRARRWRVKRARSPEDLLVLERRRELDSAERVELERLHEDEINQVLSRVGRAFDAKDGAAAVDDALAMRVAERAVEQFSPVRADALTNRVVHTGANVASNGNGGSRRDIALRKRRPGGLLGAAIGLAAAAAAAGGGYVALKLPTAPPRASASLPAADAPPRREPRQPKPSAPAAARASEPELPRAEPEPSAAHTPSPDSPAVSAAALFSRANSERRSGKLTEASASYQALVARFPESSEAQVARISLGNLLLAQGAHARALAQFDGHLRRGGQLVEEALYGKARALRALGRSAEEHEVWRTLATRYPNSIYARSARERLGESP